MQGVKMTNGEDCSEHYDVLQDLADHLSEEGKQHIDTFEYLMETDKAAAASFFLNSNFLLFMDEKRAATLKKGLETFIKSPSEFWHLWSDLERFQWVFLQGYMHGMHNENK
jgi:hypothetical protein